MLLAAFTVCQTAYAMTDSLKLLRAQGAFEYGAVMFVSIRVGILLGESNRKKVHWKIPYLSQMSCIKISRSHSCCFHAAVELWLPAQTTVLLPLQLALSYLPLRELYHHELLRKHDVRTHYFLQLFAVIGYL